MMQLNKKDIIYIVIIVGLVLFLLKTCNDSGGTTVLLNACNDTLKITKNELGQEIASRQSLVATNKELHSIVSRKDSNIMALQKLVNKRTASAVIFTNITSESISQPTELLFDNAAVKTDTIYPVYTMSETTKWHKVNVVANKDSVLLNYLVFNDFEVKTSWEKDGFLKPRKAIISVLNKNPNTETTNLSSFTERPPKKDKWKYLTAGLIAGVIGGALIR